MKDSIAERNFSRSLCASQLMQQKKFIMKECARRAQLKCTTSSKKEKFWFNLHPISGTVAGSLSLSLKCNSATWQPGPGPPTFSSSLHLLSRLVWLAVGLSPSALDRAVSDGARRTRFRRKCVGQIALWDVLLLHELASETYIICIKQKEEKKNERRNSCPVLSSYLVTQWHSECAVL